MNSERKYQMFLHAFQTVPYYQKLVDIHPEYMLYAKEQRNWEKLPLTEKEDVVFRQGEMISEEYLGRLAVGQLLRSHTSGSTGTYLDVYWEKSEHMAALMPLWVERYKYGKIHTIDRVCIFNNVLQNNKEYQIEGAKMIISKQNLSIEKLSVLYDKILEFNPIWCLLHPGIAIMLMQVMRKYNFVKPPALRYIELTGEMLLDGLESELEKVFEVKVRCHYGTIEVNTIGIEELKGYRVFEESTYVEVLNSSGEVVKDDECGYIYVTSLCNKAMPILRYGTGDIGIIRKDDKGHKVIELSKARKNDMLRLPNGEMIPPDVLLGPVEKINQISELMIYQFQVIQKSLRVIIIKVVLDVEMSEEEFIETYQELLEERWKGEFEWKFEFYDDLQPNNKTGKLAWFISEIKS